MSWFGGPNPEHCNKRVTLGQGSGALCELPPGHESIWHEMVWDTRTNERVVWTDELHFVRGGTLGDGYER